MFGDVITRWFVWSVNLPPAGRELLPQVFIRWIHSISPKTKMARLRGILTCSVKNSLAWRLDFRLSPLTIALLQGAQARVSKPSCPLPASQDFRLSPRGLLVVNVPKPG